MWVSSLGICGGGYMVVEGWRCVFLQKAISCIGYGLSASNLLGFLNFEKGDGGTETERRGLGILRNKCISCLSYKPLAVNLHVIFLLLFFEGREGAEVLQFSAQIQQLGIFCMFFSLSTYFVFFFVFFLRFFVFFFKKKRKRKLPYIKRNDKNTVRSFAFQILLTYN